MITDIVGPNTEETDTLDDDFETVPPLEEFVLALKELCNLYGVTLSGCDCGGIYVQDSITPIEDFEMLYPENDEEEMIHIEAKHTQKVLAA